MPRRLLCPPRAAQASPRVAYLLVQTSVLLLGCLMVRMMVSPPDFEPESGPISPNVKRLADRFLDSAPGSSGFMGRYPTLSDPSECGPDLSGSCTPDNSASPAVERCATFPTPADSPQPR